LGYSQYHVLSDYGPARTTFERISKMLPNSSDVLLALARIARREGHWGQSVVYDEQALTLDPRNRELLGDTPWNYTMLRQFPAALKVEDRVLDITPNNPSVLASKASIYQAEGNLQEAARLLAAINEQTPSAHAFIVKITQLRLERNYLEAVQLFQARPTQFHFVTTKKPLISWRLLWCSGLLATRLAQRLPLNRRAIHSSRSRRINQTTSSLPHCCPTVMP
jgi:tetratricopeptide (TPR) repeat protein